jgi:hypothetical protein
MLVAQVIGTLLLIGLVIGDWIHFASMAAPARRYGCGIARVEGRLSHLGSVSDLRFNHQGLWELPHGLARLYRKDLLIVLRPHAHRFSPRFRTAWPMKATIHLQADDNGMRLGGTKRIPWSSALLTLAWFLTVAVGTVGFLIAFLLNGGFASFGGTLLGLGVLALGLFVLGFGLVIVALAYRLENQRLMQVYEELHQSLTKLGPASS